MKIVRPISELSLSELPQGNTKRLSRGDESPTASIVITTRNRTTELRRAIESCLSQTGISFEVCVYDDGSTDGTVCEVARSYPEVKIFPHQTRAGLVVRRNQGLNDAAGKFIFSLDDDAYFTDRRTIARAVDLFDEFPNAGAIALPYIEPSREADRSTMSPVKAGSRLRSFIGCAHALRRDVALQLGGYRELLVHQGEERDLCIRLLDAGYDVIFGDTPYIVHCPSPTRELDRAEFYGYRNTMLFHWSALSGFLDGQTAMRSRRWRRVRIFGGSGVGGEPCENSFAKQAACKALRRSA